MLKIKQLSKEPKIFRVISEPGDCTRYNFIVIENYTNYSIAPYKYILKYPQLINIWDIEGIDNPDKVIEIAKEYNCNPYTVRVVISAIKEINNAAD